MIAAAIVPMVTLVAVAPAQAARPVVGHPAKARATVTCGETITTSTVLMNNVGPCSTEFGITLAGSNITLNLNGHRIVGDKQPTTTLWGIHVFSSPGDTIENGEITGFATGVYLERTTGDTIQHMDIHDNVGPRDGSTDYGEGIQIYQGGSNIITSNEIVHNGTFAGIDSYTSSNNTFTNNNVLDNNIIQLNSVHLGPTVMQDIGIWVLNLNAANPGGATNNLVKGNDVINNGLDGIQIARYTNSNQVANNQAVRNGFGQVKGIRDGDGVAIFGSDNIVQSNDSTANAANGVRVVSGGQSNQVTGNESYLNGTGPNSGGIAFDLADTNVSPPCDSNTWSGNLFGTVNQSCVRSH
ncbi:MAG: right-handed parallel beta-helix repeat-containing protein [Acidimicrobiales bacterium]